MDVSKLQITQLLNLYNVILEELRDRGIIRTSNNPVADYAEWLFVNKYHLKLMNSSFSSYDAIDTKFNIKYQVKSRRLGRHSKSYQLGVIRNLNKKPFDYLVAIIFNEDYSVKEAYQIPHTIIKKYARFSEHQNGHILILRHILKDKKVKDITLALSKFQKKLL